MTTYQAVLDQYKAANGILSSATQSLKVIGWAFYDTVPNDGSERIGGWGGDIKHGDRWQDYIGECDEEDAPYYEALRHEILRRGLKQGGDWHQNDSAGVPVFSDGSFGLFSMRAWGDLMAAVWAEQENRNYSYMDFYMDSRIPSN